MRAKKNAEGIGQKAKKAKQTKTKKMMASPAKGDFEAGATRVPAPATQQELALHLDRAEELFLRREWALSLSEALSVVQLMMGYGAASPTCTVHTVHLPKSGLHDHFCQDLCTCFFFFSVCVGGRVVVSLCDWPACCTLVLTLHAQVYAKPLSS